MKSQKTSICLVSITLAISMLLAEQSLAKQQYENWSEVRKTVYTNPKWGHWIQHRKRLLDTWIASDREDFGADAGWMHAYTNPKGESNLTWTTNDPKPPQADKLNSAAWIAFNRMHNIRQTVEASRLSIILDSTEYSSWAISQLLSYATAYEKLPVKTWGGHARLMNQTLDEAVFLIEFCEAYRLLKPEISKEKQIEVETNFIRKVNASFAKSRIPGNIAFWQATASYVSSLVIGDEALRKEAVKGSYGLVDLINRYITSDGFTTESSLGYQAYVVSALSKSLLYSKIYADNKTTELLESTVHRLIKSAFNVRITERRFPNPGDTVGQPAFGNKDFNSELIRAIRTDIGGQHANETYSWNTLLASLEESEYILNTSSLGKSPRTLSNNTLNIRRPPWSAFFKFGEPSGLHSHEDLFNVELAFNNIDILVDQGTVGYGSPLHEKYFKRAVGHNTILIDGKYPAPTNQQVKSTIASDDRQAAAYYLSAETGSKITREIQLGDKFEQTTTTENLSKEITVLHVLPVNCEMKTARQPDFTVASSKFETLELFELQNYQHHTKEFSTKALCAQSLFNITIDISVPSDIWVFNKRSNINQKSVPPSTILIETRAKRSIAKISIWQASLLSNTSNTGSDPN
jgi:oligo-alginate lyase